MSGIQVLIMVFLAIFLGNLMSYLIEDFQSDDDLSAYLAWIYSEIVFNLFTLRIFVPILLISQKQGFRQFMRSAVLELASEFKCLQSRNSIRLSGTQITTNLLPLETIQGHKNHEEATHRLDALIKIEDGMQEQEDVKTQLTVVLNTVNFGLEPFDKPDLKNIKATLMSPLRIKHKSVDIKEEIGNQPGMVIKGKGKGKGKSNFKKVNALSPKNISDDKPSVLATKNTPHTD